MWEEEGGEVNEIHGGGMKMRRRQYQERKKEADKAMCQNRE